MFILGLGSINKKKFLSLPCYMCSVGLKRGSGHHSHSGIQQPGRSCRSLQHCWLPYGREEGDWHLREAKGTFTRLARRNHMVAAQPRGQGIKSCHMLLRGTLEISDGQHQMITKQSVLNEQMNQSEGVSLRHLS